MWSVFLFLSPGRLVAWFVMVCNRLSQVSYGFLAENISFPGTPLHDTAISCVSALAKHHWDTPKKYIPDWCQGTVTYPLDPFGKTAIENPPFIDVVPIKTCILFGDFAARHVWLPGKWSKTRRTSQDPPAIHSLYPDLWSNIGPCPWSLLN